MKLLYNVQFEVSCQIANHKRAIAAPMSIDWFQVRKQREYTITATSIELNYNKPELKIIRVYRLRRESREHVTGQRVGASIFIKKRDAHELRYTASSHFYILPTSHAPPSQVIADWHLFLEYHLLDFEPIFISIIFKKLWITNKRYDTKIKN